jgi:TonB-linked SusC/RagA family outer membrane protein
MNLQQTKKFSFSLFLLLLLTAGVFAQVRTVTGQVTDPDGKPIQGVTVVVKGTAGNVITDRDGKYRVQATPEQSVVFTHIAFNSKEVKVGEHPTIDVSLSKGDSQMDDVIVIGYGSQRQRNVTGAVNTVNMLKIADQPVPSITEALRGQIPGLAVQNTSYRPGFMPTLAIRQQFNWGKDNGNPIPLIVIDDQIQVDPATGQNSMDRFNQLDMSEVESITVLRDGVAAIYGSRASQGAIIVKTKRGKIGPPKIAYAGKFETNDAISFGKTLSAYEYGVFANRFGRSLGNWAPEAFFSNAELEQMKSLNYDWLNTAWKPAQSMQHSLTVSGGSDRATYFMGGSYYSQGANLGSQDFKRYTFRAGSDVAVASGLKLSATIAATNTNLQKSFTKIGISDGSYGQTAGEQSDYSIIAHMPKYVPWIATYNGKQYYVSPPLGPNKLGVVKGNNSLSNTNYFALLNNGSQQTTKAFTYNANFSLAYEVPFIKGLSFKANYAIQSSSSTDEQDMFAQNLIRNNSGLKAPYHLYDDSTKWDAPVLNTANSRVTYSNTTGTTEQINFYANYDRSFGDHNISVVLSGEREKNTSDFRYEIYDNPIPGAYNGTSVSAGTPNTSNSYTTRAVTGVLSYLGRLSYNYKSKYLFQFLFRSDASAVFAPENYWGFFPSASAGWIISDEDFFRDNVPFVNFLKLRASFGKLGNNNILPWKWTQLYDANPDRSMAFGANGGNFATGVSPAAAPNRNVKWDQVIQRNIGLDFSVLRNRLTVNIDKYFNTGSNVLTIMAGAIGVPVTVGGGYTEENYAGYNSWGTEITATWKDRIANKVDYTVSMNFGTGDNKTTKYFDQPFAYPDIMNTRNAVGNSTSNAGIWGFRTWKGTSTGDGILRTDDDINNYWQYLTDNASKSGIAGAAPNYQGTTSKTGLKKGSIAYEDVAGLVNTTDKTQAGPNGDIEKDQDYVQLKKHSRTYGLNTNLSFSYKGITLSAQLVTSWGGYNTLDYIKNNYNSTASLWNPASFMRDMYDSTDNPLGKYPSLGVYDGANSDFYHLPSFRMYLRTLSVGYTLPRNFVKRARLDNARIYISGLNLWDFYNPYPDKYRNMYDAPNVAYPTLRTWALGVNLGF